MQIFAGSLHTHKAEAFAKLGMITPCEGKDESFMGAEIRIHQADGSDLNAVAALFNQYRIFYGKQDNAVGAARFIGERLALRDSVIFVAAVFRDGIEAAWEAAGFVQLYPSFSSLSMSRLWILNDLYVAKPFRGHGIGRELLNQAKEHALRSGASALTLSTHPGNLAARRLYESAGYVEDSEFVCYNFSL